MKCTRCGDDGASRLKVTFQNDSNVVLYLCGTCREEMNRDEEVSDLSGAPAN